LFRSSPAINPLQGSTTTAAIAKTSNDDSTISTAHSAAEHDSVVAIGPEASTVQRVASDESDTEHGVAAQATTTAYAVLPSVEQPVGDTETRTPSASVVTQQAVVVPAFYSELRARDPSINIAVLPKHGRRSAWLWLLALFTAAVLLLWQFNYFFFDALTQNQRLRPMLDRACEVIGCQLPVRYNPALLVLFNTRILSHPADPQAVRVISELQNHATFSQPAPLLQLSLSDPRGGVVARRSFPPSAYLPAGQGSTIAAGGSREVVLDLASPGKSAVGFELKIVVTDRSSP